LLSLATILPDLDLFTNGHRAYGHSILFPFILLSVAPLFANRGPDWLSTKNIRYFGIFWITHLLYDTTFGPLAIFFPIDPRFYDIKLGVVINVASRVVVPIGIFAKVTLIDQRTGISTFFVNWSSAQRIQYFGGSHVDLSITDFFLHLTIFLWYIIFVVAPFVNSVRTKSAVLPVGPETSPPPQNDRILVKIPFIPNFSKRQWINMFCLLLLTTGFFFSGPFHGKMWNDNSTESSSLFVLSDTMQLQGSKLFQVPSNTHFTLHIEASSDIISYQLFVVQLPSEQIRQITDNISGMVNNYLQQKSNLTTLITAYQQYIQSSIDKQEAQLVTADTKPTWSFSTNQSMSILFGVYAWNTHDSFVNTLTFHSSWKVDMNTSYLIGFACMGISAFVLVAYIGVVTRKLKKDN